MMKASTEGAASPRRRRAALYSPRIVAWSLALSLAGYISPASAQFKLQESFTGTTAPGWTLSGNAFLTAPAIDAVGAGWLRLTNAVTDERGLALSTQSFAGNVPVTVRVSYVSWGGTGADGTTVFLFDSTQNMSGASDGGGLGYCNGAGGYLAVGLDEYGNFSNPGDHCSHGGGPGRTPESLVIRGPESSGNPYVTGVPVPGGIDNPHVASRPSPKTVLVTLTPAAVGYTVTALFQEASGDPYQILFSNAPFPYAAPASLSVGFSGSTGGSTNNHELQGLTAATPDDLQVTMSGPATVLEGAPVTYIVTLTNNGANAIDAADSPTLTDALPGAITGVTWTCVASAGASCTATGAGNLSESGLTLPSNASVTYTITGTLAPATCGTTVTNTASADFSSSSTFIDPDPTNNSASVTSTVSCAVALLTNPDTLSFAPQTVGTPSAPLSVTVIGANGVVISNISTTGDFTQTNDCHAALSGTSCTIEVVFTPQSEQSLNGTLVVTSSAASSPTTVTLSGTGANTVPNPFAFTPLNNVDPGTTQVSTPITVTGTNVPTTISVSSGAEYSINGGPYTSTPGVVPPGAQVTVRLTSAAAYGTSKTVTLTIGGVSVPFTVTTRALLQNVSVTSGGGGALSPVPVMVLALFVLLRIGRARLFQAVALLLLAGGLCARPAAAANGQDQAHSNWYLGGDLGDVTSTLSASDVTNHLQADGYQVVASEVERSSLSGGLYIGYDLANHFALEFGWSYLGRTRTELTGFAPPNMQQLLADASQVTRGSGDAWSLVARYNWTLRPRVSLDLRAGPYRWITHSDLWIGSVEDFSRNDRGWGYTFGLAPRYALSERLSVGFGVRYFSSTEDNHFVQVAATIEYRVP